jgi:hypothetical protein
MMEGPKKIYRMGQCWCEKPTHEDNKGYVPADLTDALVEASEEVLKELEDAHHQDIVSSRTTKELESALAAYRGEK